MASSIDKKTLEHLAALARIELNAKEEDGLLMDLAKILDHFQELQALDTSNVSPMAGGSMRKNVFREDEESSNTDKGTGVKSFPEKEGGHLRIPPVFGE